MFKAIWKYFRAIGYLLTGRITKAREALLMNEHVIKASYDDVIKEKKNRLNTYKDAVSSLVAAKTEKEEKLKTASEDAAKFEKLKQAALQKAQKVAAKHNGDKAATLADPEYQKWQSAFKDYSSTAAEKQARCDELEADIERSAGQTETYKRDMQSLMRELEKIKEEKHETVAEVISAKEQKQIADMMSGLADDKTGEQLQELRELRGKARAGAQVASELAGLDTKREEEDLLSELEADAADDEFAALMGFKEEAPVATESAPNETEKLPEA